ncbi:LLM class flavin-dependent oxidoreductase [Amycolatopsis acidicola]|uniref:LLM class flavin-dependent oxidoreductase n=1 Tax=Amycolatopsis acidicola TaxID=2596893 RepID=A0A5N0V632_9PSEU|nr:LLM class flavin-dependent oxidoreductase [Amycolatopsis acidicola]KAA9160521.1 LLM class flavin-dependent oxidoreductase [Amycolatopsis acidicola]
MKVGLYFDLRVPARSGLAPARVYAHMLEMCEEAERAGIDSVWFSEHHRFDDGYLPQPLTAAAAVAARTRRIRIGTAVVVAPLHHPAEIAEQAAVVDLLSGGRLDLGLSGGYRVPELELYQRSSAGRLDTTVEMARQLRTLWTGGATPAPVQSRLPIWLGFSGPRGARAAGLLGEGLLFLNPAQLTPYRQGLADGGHDPGGARVSGPVFALPSEDPERDWAQAREFIAYQQDSYRRHSVEGMPVPPRRPFDAEDARTRPMSRPGYFWFDTPEALATRIRDSVAGLPVDTVFLWASVGGMPEDLVERNVSVICQRLAPLLKTAPCLHSDF